MLNCYSNLEFCVELAVLYVEAVKLYNYCKPSHQSGNAYFVTAFNDIGISVGALSIEYDLRPVPRKL